MEGMNTFKSTKTNSYLAVRICVPSRRMLADEPSEPTILFKEDLVLNILILEL